MVVMRVTFKHHLHARQVTSIVRNLLIGFRGGCFYLSLRFLFFFLTYCSFSFFKMTFVYIYVWLCWRAFSSCVVQRLLFTKGPAGFLIEVTSLVAQLGL